MATIPPDATARRVVDLSSVLIRPPVSSATDSVTGAPIVEFLPPLSSGEQATYDAIVAVARSGSDITPAEYAALNVTNGPLPTLRTFQQMSQSEFIALAQNARDRALFDSVTALIRVIRALMRD